MNRNESTYLNNAATSYPKPDVVLRAVAQTLARPPQEPGRTGASTDPLTHCRKSLAALLGVENPFHVVLLPSATHALNHAILGLLSSGDHAISTDLEHNSVLRPLAHASRERGVKVDIVPAGSNGRVSATDIARVLKSTTRVIVMTHASNVTGVAQPLDEVATLAARRGVFLVVDCAQSAGVLDICYRDLPGRVFLAVAGHKGLGGPAGTGALVVPDDQLPQTIFGGTGIHSEHEEHPADLPLRHEAGTPNLSGLDGLAAGACWVSEQSVDRLGQNRAVLVRALRSGLADLGRSIVTYPRDASLTDEDARCGVVSFVVEGHEPGEIGFILREAFAIEVRTGLHCAPLIHNGLGTVSKGTVRASFGAFNTLKDVDRLVQAVAEVAK